MPLLILIAIGAILIGKSFYDSCTKNHHVFTGEELDATNREMVGKSQKECRQIIKKYSE